MRHLPRKRFGQNFLRDDLIIDNIIRAVAPSEGDHIVEIGPGHGALTQGLISSGCRLDAIELDRDLRASLLAAFSTFSGFALHNADALKFNFRSLISDEGRFRVVGNLPYNISTALIFKLLNEASLIADMHFMLQLEVVERLVAKPGSKNWGRLSVMTQFLCSVEHLFTVPPEAFYPRPKVQSAVIRLTPHANSTYTQVNHGELTKIVSQAFSQRRKTLRNNFKGQLTDGDFEALNINPSARAETLSIEQFISIAVHSSTLDIADL